MTRLRVRVHKGVEQKIHVMFLSQKLKRPNMLLSKCVASLGGLEPPTFRLTAERANRLRHRDGAIVAVQTLPYIVCAIGKYKTK